MEVRQVAPLKEAFPTVKEVTKSFFDKTNHQMSEDEVELLKKSLIFRKEKSEDVKWGGNIFSQSEVLGIYLVALNNGDKKEDYFLVVVSNSPIQILTRTTGRKGYSCEQIDQPYWKGPFQDLAYLNPTVYFYEPNDDFLKADGLDIEKVLVWIRKNNNITGFKWSARLNTRWCITNKKRLDVGIDPNIYPMDGMRPPIYLDFMVAIWYIYESKGFLNYRVAETPYVYVGHSDSTRGGGTLHLPFMGLKNRINWSATEEACYQVMEAVGMESSNKKETPMIDLIPLEDEVIIDADYEEEEEIVDKIMVMQRLTEMEVETLRELLKYNYRYDEVVVDAMDEDEIQDEFKKIWKL
tara:strand:- start:3166 stop:4221 length:1056 start_codon:yes stop_codon:yes gene_type:complete